MLALVRLALARPLTFIVLAIVILFAPTLVGTIYGMNFNRMPELHWALGYPFAIVLMAVVCTSLYVIFKRRDWL